MMFAVISKLVDLVKRELLQEATNILEGGNQHTFHQKAAFAWDHVKHSSKKLDGEMWSSLPALLSVLHTCRPFYTLMLQLVIEKQRSCMLLW